MSNLTNPSEIARETLRLLASRRVPPTPDNYLTIYHEIAGTTPSSNAFPDKQLRSLAAALPKSTPEQLRLARQLDEAVKNTNWESYQSHLADFCTSLAETQKLAWADLIGDLLRQWDAKHIGLTVARKRESLEHVLKGGTNHEVLFNRLQNLLRSWGEGRENPAGNEATEATEEAGKPVARPGGAPPDLLPELRELFAFTLESAIATQLLESPQLSSDAKTLAKEIRKAANRDELQGILGKLKRFAFKLELLAEDQAELRQSLLNLLRLLVENMTELVMDDRWLLGQIEVVREIIDKPLSQRNIDDAERRLKEVIFKQGQLKQSLQEAKTAIKLMLTSFVDHLANFADATSDYHDKIETCAVKISAANNISELEAVLGEVMQETRNIQFNAQRSRDELRSAQDQVYVAEKKISQLENELEETSHLIRHDQLTGALNRRGLEEAFAKEIARSNRHETMLSLSLLDIDNFKKLNDSLGHDAGDKALIHLANICRQTLRPQDTVARFGGEEFILLLPETGLDDAAKTITRLQRELTKRLFLHDNNKVLITFSAGLTEFRPDDDQASAIKRADEAMYQAKQSGKNRVVTAH